MGVLAWCAWAAAPVAVWVCVVLVAVPLAAGPARVVCFELEEGTARREPTWAKVLGWSITLVALCDGAWCAYRLWWPQRALTAWEWFTVVIIGFAGLAIVRFSLAPRIVDFILGPLRPRPSRTGPTQASDWFVARTGMGRATRMIHCVRLDGDPAIWRVSWWRLGTLATTADRPIHYRTAVGAAGLRFVTALRIAAEPTPASGPDAGAGAARASAGPRPGEQRPAGHRMAVREPARHRPIGPVMSAIAIGGGLLALPISMMAVAIALPASNGLGIVLLGGAILALCVAAFAVAGVRLRRGRSLGIGADEARGRGLRVVTLEPLPAPAPTGPADQL